MGTSIEQAKYVEVRAGVRYWEDATLNGDEDLDGAVPCREGNLWCPIIELATGRVMDWPEGATASVHYKVCDEGEYWLLDENKQRVAKWGGHYVPDSVLCMKDNGWGDYIILEIGPEGLIKDWAPQIESGKWVPLDAAQSVLGPVASKGYSQEGAAPAETDLAHEAGLVRRIAEAASDYKLALDNDAFAAEYGGVDALRAALFELVVEWEGRVYRDED